MAYNNMFPAAYQPAQIYYSQQNPMNNQNAQAQNNGGIIWVQGEAGAKSYLVAPNNTVQLWDSEAQVIYLKSADASGMPSMKIIDYTIRDNSPREPLSGVHSEFAMKVDVDSIRKDIEALTKRVNSLTEKGGADHE